MNKSSVNFDDLAESVATLINKAKVQMDSGESMKFAQAALNAANAMAALVQLVDLKKG